MFSIKFFAFFCILVSFNEAHRRGEGGKRGDNNLVSNMCYGAANTRTCVRTAKSCFFRLPNGNTAFCFCKGNVTGVSSLYTTWVQNQRWGRDMCFGYSWQMYGGHSGENFGRSGNSFINYLAGQSAPLASAFQCCIGRNQRLYLPTGAANITVWKQQASAITNATVLAAVNAKIDSCGSSSGTACNATALYGCVVQGCYDTIKV